jgi:hypothetical protein
MDGLHEGLDQILTGGKGVSQLPLPHSGSGSHPPLAQPLEPLGLYQLHGGGQKTLWDGIVYQATRTWGTVAQFGATVALNSYLSSFD